MTCFAPLEATQEAGKKPIIWKKGKRPKHLANGTKHLELPCGQCIGCRLEKSRQWATRCIHEAQMHEDNCFITLTYDDENIPWDGSLNKQHFQAFMKRLRWHNKEKKIRYFHVGEYGEQLSRPHYHALIFNHDFDDKELWTVNDEMRLYTSEKLQKIWPMGFSTIGSVTWETAAYCSRYIMKKYREQKPKNTTGDKWAMSGQSNYNQNIQLCRSSRPSAGIGLIHIKTIVTQAITSLIREKNTGCRNTMTTFTKNGIRKKWRPSKKKGWHEQINAYQTLLQEGWQPENKFNWLNSKHYEETTKDNKK